MHQDLIKRYVELQALLLTPVAPHFSEYLWRDVLGHSDSVQNALYPEAEAGDPAITAALNYVRNVSIVVPVEHFGVEKDGSANSGIRSHPTSRRQKANRLKRYDPPTKPCESISC